MERTQVRGEGLAKGLGWFSIGLGLAEMASPQSVAQLVGIEDGARTRAMIRGYGARELANGVAILSQPDARWLWARSPATWSTSPRSRLRFNVTTPTAARSR